MRVKIISILAMSALLSACQMTPNETSDNQELDQEHQIAEQIRVSCEQSGEQVADIFDCDSAEAGTIPVTHPVDEVVVDELEAPEEVAAVDEEIVDIWQRISKQLNFEIIDDKRVTEQRDWYLRHPAYMERVAKRAKPFLHLIVEEIEKHNMPLELVLLPIVESAFDPFAYSHGRAAGMWQFIPATGKRFGMKQTWWYDGRRDVLASTKGAIAYLTYLNTMFDGNWLHALAAYNSGEGRVMAAIKRNKKANKSTEFWALDLPRETRAYVPKLLALADILKNSEKYNFVWPEIENQALTQAVDVGSQIDLALAAQMAGLTVKELHALNPGYNRWATDPDGPFELLLPIDKVSQFQQALAKTDSKERLNWVRHKVKGGDSLLKLADKYHTTVDIIAQVNELKGNMIRQGDYLVIPVALKSLDSYSLSQDQRLVATQSKKHSGAFKLSHEVKSGDTMWDISRKYKVNLRSLAKWNGMAPTDPLIPGKNLVVWVDKVTDSQSNNAIMRSLTYTVRSGDSLARIADKFKVSIKDIQQWNKINAKKYLQPGQRLKIYVDVTRT
ncbi:MAG: LysM peptidoglycan-binding domain-containing protein [Paraglaciecola sp.]|uniref:LysM peptidoglycan-binding domain-containing protein n=1 Tax=Paraglaciecola sp. TaxID=1920173 RepID=UPI00274028A0|nr:LysM peptidoglycan-binding domain-containing protein [Paraglaciecola sp.]MDP5029834.1 LysM peptidoglycan-binding domain-containing protein [Paraglaciecola sp.]MDP5133285.1 LysM peptidoglycan-binding domain-containing protein [Paraglaciecola sp.]